MNLKNYPLAKITLTYLWDMFVNFLVLCAFFFLTLPYLESWDRVEAWKTHFPFVAWIVANVFWLYSNWHLLRNEKETL